MIDPITNRIMQILNESKHLLVPIEELYNALRGEGLMSQTSEEAFEHYCSCDWG